MKKNQKYRKQKKNNALTTAILGGVFVLVGFALLAALQKPGDASASNEISNSVVPVKVDFPAPGLALENVSGAAESLKDFRGRVVLVNNWATWCPPCKAEMPSLQKYYAAHQEEGFTLVAINAGDGKPEVDK
ncbi:MAG: hypothetical protein RL275_376, partial [Chloroflexota bacterium]